MKPRNPLPPWARRAVLLFAPALILVAAGWMLGDWIIDDAGISFAYARNLAAGHGFVSSPGRPPVEGFSDFLWVLLIAPLRLMRLFDPVVVPKLLGILCVLAALFLLQRTLERRTGRGEPGLFASLWIVAAPPIAIWTLSGLENGLLLLLAVALWAAAVERGRFWQARCGVIAALLAMTRPDGIVYIGFAMVAAVLDGAPAGHLPDAIASRSPSPEEAAPSPGRSSVAARARSLGACLLGFVAVFGPFLAFRLLTFGRLWPQPYYAKRVHASFAAELLDFASHPGTVAARIAEVGRAMAGGAGPWILAALAVALVALGAMGRLRRHVVLAAGLLAIATAGYVLIDPDWMGEYRFATGAIAALAITTSAVLFSIGKPGEAPEGQAEWRRRGPDTAPRRPGGKTGTRSAGERAAAMAPLAAVATVLTLALLAASWPRLLRFAENPTTPYRDVQDRVAGRFAAYARALGTRDASILVEDVGAVLDHGALRVYDVTGLIDPEATRTLKDSTAAWRSDHPEFYDWVFDRVRPTFITTRGFWSVIPAYEYDPRFVRDYAPIESYVDGYVLQRHKLVLHSGDYVRRDALRDSADVDRLRDAYRARPRPLTRAWRVADRWDQVRRGAPSVDDVRDEAMTGEAQGNDPDRAAALYRAVLDRQPDDELALLGLARSLDRAGRAYEARPVWSRLLGVERAKGATADTVLVPFIQDRLGDGRHRAPVSPVAIAQWTRIGRRTLERDRDPRTAVRLLDEVLEVQPGNSEALLLADRARKAIEVQSHQTSPGATHRDGP